MQTGMIPGLKPAEPAMPAGMIMPYAGSALPAGGAWGWCDGTLYSRSERAALYAAIGTTYNTGGEPADSFRVPNLKGKVIVGVDPAQTEFDTLGETGGAKTVTLGAAEIPGHSHGYGHTHSTDVVNTNHAHNVYARDTNHDHAINHWHSANIGSPNVKAWSGFSHQHVNAGGYAAEGAEQGASGAGQIPVNVDGNANGAPGGTNISGGMRSNWSHDHPSTNYASESPWPGNYTHEHTTDSQSSSTTDNGTGGGGAHNNLQPYMALNYLIKL